MIEGGRGGGDTLENTTTRQVWIVLPFLLTYSGNSLATQLLRDLSLLDTQFICPQVSSISHGSAFALLSPPSCQRCVTNAINNRHNKRPNQTKCGNKSQRFLNFHQAAGHRGNNRINNKTVCLRNPTLILDVGREKSRVVNTKGKGSFWQGPAVGVSFLGRYGQFISMPPGAALGSPPHHPRTTVCEGILHGGQPVEESVSINLKDTSEDFFPF